MSVRNTLKEWHMFLMAESNLLRTHPTLLIQQAANGILTGAPARAARCRLDQGLELRPWLRRVNPPDQPSPCLLTLHGHSEWTDRCAVSPDGTRILSRSSAEVILWDLETCEALGLITVDRQLRDQERDKTGGLPCAQNFGYEIAESFFTPDSQLILTIDKGLRLRSWDSWTCAPLATLSPGKPEQSFSAAWTFSPSRPEIVFGQADGTLLLWNWRTENCRLLDGPSGLIISITFSPDGGRILSASVDGTLRIWDAVSGSCESVLFEPSDAGANGIFLPGGRSVLSVSGNGTLRIWDPADGTTGAAVITAEEAERYCLGDWSVSPDATRLALRSSGYQGNINLIDVQKGRVLARLPVQSEYDCVFSPDNRILATIDHRKVELWDGWTGAHIATLTGHRERINRLAFSPDGLQVATASKDETLRIWDTAAAVFQATLVGHSDWVNDVCWHPQGGRIVSAATDRTVRIWDVDLAKKQVWTGDSSPIEICTFSPEGMQVLTGSVDGTLKIWDTTATSVVTTLAGHEDGITTSIFSPAGTIVASGSKDRTVRLWEATTGAARAVLIGAEATVAACAFSPDGSRLLVGDFNGLLMIWDADGNRLVTMEGHQNSINHCCFSPDGRRVASASDDCTLRIWDTETGTELASLHPIDDEYARDVSRCLFAPDGSRLLSVSRDGAVRLWDTSSMKEAVGFSGHPGKWLFCAAYSPDGRFVASGGNDSLLKIWDSRTGQEMATIDKHDQVVFWCAFSPDGRRLLSASNDGTLGLWSVPDGKEIGRYAPNEGSLKPAWSPNGASLAVGSNSGKIHIIRLENIPIGPPLITAWRSPEDGILAMGCPLCRGWSAIAPDTPGHEIRCSACGQAVSLNPFLIEADWRPVAAAWKPR